MQLLLFAEQSKDDIILNVIFFKKKKFNLYKNIIQSYLLKSMPNFELLAGDYANTVDAINKFYKLNPFLKLIKEKIIVKHIDI